MHRPIKSSAYCCINDGDTPNEIVSIGARRFMLRDDDSIQFEFQLAEDTINALVVHFGPQQLTGRGVGFVREFLRHVR